MAKTFQSIIWTFLRKGSNESNEVGYFLKLLKEEVTKLQEALKVEQVLNRKQCINLVNKLHQVVLFVDEMMVKEASNKFGVVYEELGRITWRIQVLVQDCMKEEWCHAVVHQINNKEAFRELVDDLKCFYDAIFERYLGIYLDSRNCNFPHIDFNVATYDEIESDEATIMERLTKGLETMSNDSDDYELAKHLLRRLQFDLPEVKGVEMDVMEVPKDVKKPILSYLLGCGSSGYVHKSSWLGLDSATKMFKVPPGFCKEACILASLSHPNVTKFICHGRLSGKTVDEMMGVLENPYYVVMERMEMTLNLWLSMQERPLGYFVIINIMHEIARGMCYLHDMHVAHLDLNPSNVLLSFGSSLTGVEKSIGYDFVKLSGFSSSEMEVKSKPQLQKYTIGTPLYMAPEMYNNVKKNVACPFKADVWSFAMTCSEILSCKGPFLEPQITSSIMQKVTLGKRPDLPINCKELTMLIKECWVHDPSQRPTFSSICKRLAALKKKFIVGTYANDKPRFGTSFPSMQLKAFAPKKVVEQRTQREVIVGVESNLAKVRNHLRQTNILGLIGMGGIGKTTLAKVTFHDMRSLYDASCFIENLRSKSSLEILCEILQNLGWAKETNWTLMDAQKIMKNLLSTKKVFLILDDPKDEAQVHDIIPSNIQIINNGTKIIITTRAWDVIEKHVEENGKIYVGKLDTIASKELFSSYISSDGAQLSPHLFNLRDKVVEACDGLPLSLKVMGAFLQGKERIRSWERALERMKRGRSLDGDERLWSILRASFDGLNKDEKNIFLDIACLFPTGMLKETTLHIYTNGTSPIHVLDMLMNKSLVTIDEWGFLEMHDQLRDMGRMIVETDKKYLGTRIWRKNMIPLETRGAHDKNFKEVEGIYWNEHSFGLPLENCMGFNNLDLNSLRLLIYTNFNALPKALHNWASLRTLTLCESSSLTTLPNGLVNLTSLTTLGLSWCENLTTLPEGLGNLNSLTILDLSGCGKLTILPEGLGNLTSLTTLNLSGCGKLTTLPEGLGNLTSLTTLDLSICKNLITLPEGLGNLTSLTTLNLSGCGKLTTLPEGLGNLTSLTTLDLSICKNLITLPEGLGNLTSLIALDLSVCANLTTLPEGLGNLTSLTVLDLSGCGKLTILSEGLENLTSLTTLNLSICKSLTTLPEGLGNLTSLTNLNLSGCGMLTTLPEGLGNLVSLTNLNLRTCKKLTTLPKGLGNLISLATLDLSWCKNLRTLLEGLGNLTSLTTLNLSGCEKLTTLPEGLGNLTSLTTLDLSICKNLTTLPEGLGNLTSLTALDLGVCANLTALPEGLGNLTSLTILDLSGCGKLTILSEGLENLTSLTTLNLSICKSLTTLPEGLGNLTSLTNLNLSGCGMLTTLPERLGNLTSLTNLNLRICKNLTTLPEGLGNLNSLTILDLSWCKNLTTLPEGLGNLTSLTTLDLSGCANLTTLPEGLGNLTSLTLVLSGCANLTTLPEGLGNLTSLTTLGLSKCSISREVPERFENLISLIPLEDGLISDKVDERRTQFDVVVGVESNLAKVGNYLKQENIMVLIFTGAIICRAILFCTITSSIIELVFFGLLNLFPYWNHRRQHKDLCIDKCGGYLFCERVRLCMYMIYVQVCSLWVWTMVHRCHHLPNLHILVWSIVSLSLLLLLLGVVGLSKIEWKYRLWSMLKFVLRGKAYTLSSYIREVVPDLAPCNPFADIVNSHDVDKFITLRREGLENLWLPTHGEEQVLKEDIHKHIEKHGYLKRRVLYPVKTNQRHVFLIGSGWVAVDVLEEGNFRFKSSARGRPVQYFYATLSSQQFSTLVALLAMWEDSPNLGVLENFVRRSDGIYCHCMDLQSIVETLFECTDFTVVVLQKPMKFHIGAKCTREHCSTYLMATLFQVLAMVGSYFQLKDNYNNVAIVLTFLGILVVVGAFTSPSILLLEKIIVFNVLRRFRLGSQRLLRLYLQLKIWKCFLAFCDEFKPVLHQANAEPELITLFNCTHGSFTGDFDRPDWSEVEVDQTPYVANVNGETNVLTSKSGETLEYRQGSVRIFDLKCQRTVFATSTYVGDVLHTQLKLDGDVVHDYNWSEDCYFLFIYLMIKWSRREFGVIRSCRHLMYRRYYHVFNVYELARHIEIHKLTKYKKLLDDSVEAITSMTIPPKLDPANKGEMVAGYHV